MGTTTYTDTRPGTPESRRLAARLAGVDLRVRAATPSTIWIPAHDRSVFLTFKPWVFTKNRKMEYVPISPRQRREISAVIVDALNATPGWWNDPQ